MLQHKKWVSPFLLNRVAKKFDYDKGAFSNLLITALRNARMDALTTGSMKWEVSQEVGPEPVVPSFVNALEDREQLEKNIEKGREAIHLIFEKIRTKVYRDAYTYPSDTEEISNGEAEKIANDEVEEQGASYANEYILCEYLFGGKLPESPKDYEQIGKEGVPMFQQRGVYGVLEQSKERKAMYKGRISERMNKAVDLLSAYLAPRGISLPSKQRINRILLINSIVRNTEYLLAELRNDASPKCNEIAAPHNMSHDTQI